MRAKVAELDVSEADVADALAWARRTADAPVALRGGDPTGTSVEHDAICDELQLTDTPGGQ